jgi:hypothetical protein
VDIREMEFGGMGWIHLTQDRGRWRVLVNTVINLGFHKIVGKFLSS